jgi:GR25 family glycosyltransferase involved in LPS biosynthesis
MDNPFNFFDKIFYINLDSRTDRREFMEEQFKKFNIDAERFSAISLTKEQNDDLVRRGCNFYDDPRPNYAPRIK